MVIELTISIISLIAGYITSQLLERHSEKYTRKSERFEKLYAPFEKMIWLHKNGAFQFSDLAPDLQRQFFELLYNNYEYADSENFLIDIGWDNIHYGLEEKERREKEKLERYSNEKALLDHSYRLP